MMNQKKNRNISKDVSCKVFTYIFFLFILSGIANPVFAQSPWSIFRGNQQLTGFSNTELPAQPKLLFSFQTDDDIKSSPVVAENTIFCGSSDGKLYAIDFSGNLKWKFDAGNVIEAPPLYLNGSVIVGSMDGWFFRLDAKTGKQIWKYKTDNQIVGSANWVKSGNTYKLAVGSYDYNLHGVGFEKGDSLWQYESDNFINGAPAIYKNNAVFGGCDGFIHVVNMDTGKALKKIHLDTYVASSPVVEGDFLYVGDYEGRFFAVNLAEGVIKWTYDNPDKNLPFIASPSLGGNFIVIGNEDRDLYCIRKTDGSLAWKVRLSNRINASSVVCKNKVVSATMDGMVFLNDLITGKEIWNYELGSPIVGSPAVYGNKLIIGASDGRIYVFGE